MNEKMNLVIKDVILEKWKEKVGYPFNFKDFEELEIIINQFENHINYLKQQLEQRDNIINKARELIHKHIKEIENLKLRIYPKEYYELLEILNIDKGE